MKRSFFESNKLIISLHVLAWTILIGLPLYFVNRWDIGKDFIWLYYINITINGIIFYINYFFLVPGFFFDSKKYRYYISVAILLFMFYFVSDISNQAVFKYVPDGRRPEKPDREFAEKKMHGPPGPMLRLPMRPPFREMHMFNYGFTSLFLIFFSLGLKVLERHSRIEKIQKELEREKLNSELAFLKNQISPHFFFNTLNNIYSLISINAEDSQRAVLKLSKLMRYLLYESEQGDTKLSSEIDFMNNYIDLMKLRMNNKISLTVEFPVEFRNISIPPLLFIPFIENAFKHGISFMENSFISISMTCDTGNIVFKCINSLADGGNGSTIDSSGIGLINVKKRLELLYPGKHELTINQTENKFEVLLTIKLPE
jgi:two-component system, LytTR family, sensor kinase